MSDIAIIGMAGRFPKAKNVSEFWHNLRNGVEAVTYFSDEELRAAGVEENLIRDPNYVRGCNYLEGADLFDAGFFEVNPREAELTDPQQRVFLEDAITRTEEVLARHRSELAELGAGLAFFETSGRRGAIAELEARLDWLRATRRRLRRSRRPGRELTRP